MGDSGRSGVVLGEEAIELLEELQRCGLPGRQLLEASARSLPSSTGARRALVTTGQIPGR